jgi:hypothetical protein
MNAIGIPPICLTAVNQELPPWTARQKVEALIREDQRIMNGETMAQLGIGHNAVQMILTPEYWKICRHWVGQLMIHKDKRACTMCHHVTAMTC